MNERSHHGTSHLGRCNIDALITGSPVTLRRHLEIYLHAAENKMKNGLRYDAEAMWLRGWTEWKEYRSQIALLDAALEEVMA